MYLLTHSAVALGIIGLLQAIPRLLLPLVRGVFADRFDRRKLLLVIEAAMATSSVVLALCTHVRVITLVIIYSVVLLAASVSAFEFPTRQAIIPTLVPRSQLASAVTLSSVMMQLTFVLGAAFGGYTVAWLGVVNTYWLDVFSYLAVIGSILFMRVPRIPLEKRAQSNIGALIDGSSNLYGAVALAPFTGLIGRIPRQGFGVVLAIVGWGICIVGFGFSSGALWLSVFLLAGAGAADMVSMILRGLIIQLTTADEFRGRISVANAMFVIGGPILGQFESGVVAGFTTPQFSVISGGVACIVATLIVAACIPGLLRAQIK